MLASTLQQVDKIDEAQSQWLSAVAIEPDNPVPYYFLASFLNRHCPAENEEALELVEKATFRLPFRLCLLFLPSRQSLMLSKNETRKTDPTSLFSVSSDISVVNNSSQPRRARKHRSCLSIRSLTPK